MSLPHMTDDVREPYKTALIVTATGNSLMRAAEKGPTETEEARERRVFKERKEESAQFGNAEGDHHG
jgi:hypothetical protein